MDVMNYSKITARLQLETGMSSLALSEQLDLSLITLVHQNPHLYDYKIRDYKNKRTKQITWREIARTLQLSVDNCMYRWKILRESYTRQLRENSKYLPDESPDKRKKVCRYFEQLAFLNTHIRRTSNCRPYVPESICIKADPVINRNIKLGEEEILHDDTNEDTGYSDECFGDRLDDIAMTSIPAHNSPQAIDDIPSTGSLQVGNSHKTANLPELKNNVNDHITTNFVGANIEDSILHGSNTVAENPETRFRTGQEVNEFTDYCNHLSKEFCRMKPKKARELQLVIQKFIFDATEDK